MKTDKIKNYNQKVLAILGTIGVILAVVGLISFSAMIIDEFFRFNDYNDDTGILSEKEVERLQIENKREQVISYDSPRLTDTINSIYIIPVSHKNLNEQEDINGLLDLQSGSRKISKSDNRYSSRIFGEFNNLIIYDQNSGKSKKLFDQRVNFNKIETEYFSDDILILTKVAEKDTYKDGVINLKDNKSLYLYSFNEKSFSKIGIDGLNVISFKFLNNTKDLIISFGIDKDQNGNHDNYNEPSILKKFDYNSGELTDLINDEIQNDLQKLLEGSAK